MAANNPNNVNAKTVQGPDPTGNQGYPVAVVPAIGADPFPIGPLPPGSEVVVTDIEDGAGDSVMDAANNAVRVNVVVGGTSSVVVTNILDGAGDSIMNAALNAAQVSVVNTPSVDTELDAAAALSDTTANPTTARVGACQMLWNNVSSIWVRKRSIVSISDGIPGPAIGGEQQFLYQGLDLDTYVKQRNPNIFRTVATAAAGNTALWTPALGNQFQLMRYLVSVTGDAATAAGAVITISLFDGAAGATGQVHSVFCPAVALAANELYNSGWIDLGNGVLSAANNNVLNVNLSAALTAGVVRVIACGTEE